MQFELAQAEHGVRRAVLAVQRNHFLESVSRFRVVVTVIFDGSQGPPSVGPFGLKCKSLCVEGSGFVEAIFAAGLCGLLGERFELSGARLAGLRTGLNARAEEQ